MRTSRRLLGVVAGAGAAATGVAATALTVATRQRRKSIDPYADEVFGDLQPDRVSTVAADDGLPLHVEEIDPSDGGQADLTLIGLHGFALSSVSWHFQRRDLAALTLPRVRQVYFDQRGHGQSGRATDDTATLEQLASDLHAVIRALAPDGPIVLMGHSVGGMTIMALAEAEPELFAERVCGVSLISTAAGEVATTGLPRTVLSRFSPVGWGVDRIGDLADWQPEIVELVRVASGQLTKQAVRRLAFGGEASPRLVEFVLAQVGVTPVRDLVRFIATMGVHDRYEALSGLKHANVQVVAGGADMLLPMRHSERIVAELPDAQLVHIEGAGHVPHLEHADVVNSYLIDLLQRCAGVGLEEAPIDYVRRMPLAIRLRRWFR